MEKIDFDMNIASWDRYRAFYTVINGLGLKQPSPYSQAPVILFDTGEVIVTNGQPQIPSRRMYLGRLELTTTTELNQNLYLPDGTKIPKAWLDDNGMQYLLLDHEQRLAVRLDGVWLAYKGSDCEKQSEILRPGFPRRFQTGAFAYIPGPYMPPIGAGKIRVNPTIAHVSTKEEREKVRTFVDCFMAQMKLTDDDCIRLAGPTPVPFDDVLDWETPNDVPLNLKSRLFHSGVGRPAWHFDALMVG